MTVALRARGVPLLGEAVVDDLLARYAEPHRRYHTVEHLAEVLGVFDDLRDLAADPRAVEIALWFHDAVYDPRAAAGENERASAALIEACSDADAEARRLVELTASHGVDDHGRDANGAVMVDCDLSILGAAEERYALYAADVRAEYRWVDDAAWRDGRSALLRGFLDRERLFVTGRAHDRFDAAARRNLRAELATLSSRAP